MPGTINEGIWDVVVWAGWILTRTDSRHGGTNRNEIICMKVMDGYEVLDDITS